MPAGLKTLYLIIGSACLIGAAGLVRSDQNGMVARDIIRQPGSTEPELGYTLFAYVCKKGVGSMARILKRGADAASVQSADKALRKLVEDILADIEMRGHVAVRELSRKFDGWDRVDFRLTDRNPELSRSAHAARSR